MANLITQTGIKPVYTPGSYFIRKAYGWNRPPAWDMVNFRTDTGWVDTCPQLPSPSLQTAAAARGVIRRLTIRLVTGGSISVSEEAIPSDRYNSATTSAPVLQTDWDPNLIQYRWWMRGDVDIMAIEVELWFDILLP